jgi:Replication protein
MQQTFDAFGPNGGSPRSGAVLSPRRGDFLRDPLSIVHRSTLSAKGPPEAASALQGTVHDQYKLIRREWVDERYAPPPATSAQVLWRHSHWATARERVRRAMVDAGYGLARRYSFQECGGGATIEICPDTGAVRVRARCCHDRWCRACGRARRQKVAIAMSRQVSYCQSRACRVGDGLRMRHVVLTLAGRDAPLGEQLSRLLDAFGRLRSGRWWRSRVDGGCWAFEVTYSHTTSQWHPHLHCLVFSKFLKVGDLSAEWLRCTGDSHRVHVSLVAHSAAAVQEVTKYIGKITHRSWEQDQRLLAHAMRQLNGRRLNSTFGAWRGVQLDGSDTEATAATWISWGSLDELLRLNALGDPDARALMRALQTGEPVRVPAANSPTSAESPPGSRVGPAPP